MQFSAIKVLTAIKSHAWLFLAAVCLAIGASFWGMERLGIAAATILALVSLPFTCSPSGKKPYRWPLAISAVLTLLMAGAQLAPLYFLVVALWLMYLIGNALGQQELLPYLLLGFGSSAFSYFAKVFAFPIRLWLSQAVVSSMQWVGFTITAKGNLIYWKGHDFVVDEACMGLHLTEVGMVLSLAMLGYLSQSHQKNTTSFWAVFISLLAFGLLLLSNLARIAGIVLLQAKANTLGHELIGIFSLAFYTLLPLFFIIRWVVRYFPASTLPSKKWPNTLASNQLPIFWYALLIVVGAWLGSSPPPLAPLAPPNIPAEFKANLEQVQPHIWKTGNGQSLIYLKTNLHSYRSDHSPMVCWQGSGYQLREVMIDSSVNMPIYRGQLHLNDTILHTAWWYTSAQHQTISQLDWRFRSILLHEDYQLINITCANAKDLKASLVLWSEFQKFSGVY